MMFSSHDFGPLGFDNPKTAIVVADMLETAFVRLDGMSERDVQKLRDRVALKHHAHPDPVTGAILAGLDGYIAAERRERKKEESKS